MSILSIPVNNLGYLTAMMTQTSEAGQEKIYEMGLMHDIGKIGVSEDIINKTSRLTDEEFAEIKKHTVIGYGILSTITEMPDLSVGARYHHEKLFGGCR